MERRHRWVAAATLAAATLTAAAVAPAQVARSGGSANTQLLEQMQQIASERTQLQAENERLKGELADVKKERDALKAGQQAVVRRAQGAAAELAHSTAQREATEQELTQYKARMQELIDKFRETIQKLREAETEGATVRQTLATRERELNACIDHDLALYRLNDEVLTHYEHQGFWSRMAQAEPFTQIKRVQNENLIDDYRSRALEQLAPGAKPGAKDTTPAPAPRPATPAAPRADASAH
jgi:predicted RNase H-like nuclease (RuvC/YqgF family)